MRIGNWSIGWERLEISYKDRGSYKISGSFQGPGPGSILTFGFLWPLLLLSHIAEGVTGLVFAVVGFIAWMLLVHLSIFLKLFSGCLVGYLVGAAILTLLKVIDLVVGYYQYKKEGCEPPVVVESSPPKRIA